MDRLLALMLGLRYRQVVTFRRTCITLLGMWIFSILGTSSFLWDPVIHRWYTYSGVSLSLVALICSNTKIFSILRHSQIQVQNHVVQGQPSQAIPSLNIARYNKAVYGALWVQEALVVCYLPHGIAVALTPAEGMRISIYLARQYTVSLVYLNSSLNPLLYCWKIREVRKAVKDSIRLLYC